MSNEVEKEFSENSEENLKTDNEVPKEFKEVINDFCRDIKLSFPEIVTTVDSYYEDGVINDVMLFEYIKSVYPERFFDILYQNNDIFNEDSEMNCHFLPNIDFKNLWKLKDLSENTKETIWKYLQLLLYTSVGNMKQGD